MVLELDRKTFFPYPVYEQPTSYPYNARRILDRVLNLIDLDKAFKDAAFELYEKAIKDSEYPLGPPEVGAGIWDEERALTNLLIETEETRNLNQKYWQPLKKILTTLKI